MTYYWTVFIVLIALFAGGGILAIVLGYRMMKGVDRARFGRRNQYGAETFEDYDTAHSTQLAENTRMVVGRLMLLAGIGSTFLSPFISLMIISTM
ncbi:hypothetical protein [Inquilinus sp. CAU 1745]|uniref:hypothetical protein n=1 Tax=Inquilinus sp. CAU 1745 TaxID=3140369 RepID=UPI00325C0EEF